MMKRILLFCLTILNFTLFAQIPVNDDCAGIIDLGIAPNCDSTTIFTNVNATTSEIFNPPSPDNIPSCWDNVTNDVWFQFVVPTNGSIVDFTIEITGDDANGNQIVQPQLAVYRGDCFENELDELLCVKSEVGESTLELDLEGLTPGITYFLRVDDFSASATPNSGEFYVCVDSLREVNTIDEGGSTSCSGELYDTGGPDEDYSGNENFVYTICPPAPSNTCITYTLEYFNVEQGVDEINIYDGDGTGTAPIGSISGSGFNDGDNWGGVCYVAQASSGCLTVEFISDGATEFEGFASNWQCSTQPCEPLNQLSVDLNVDADGIADVIASPETVVTIDTIICANGSIGTFEADGTDLGLSKGLLLSSGLAMDAIRDAIHAYRNLQQRPDESEMAFISRISQASYRCGNVFEEDDKMTTFVNGLSPTIRTLVARFRETPPVRHLTFMTLTQFARDEGIAYRARQPGSRSAKTSTWGPPRDGS